MKKDYDYLIVGAGLAGSVFAHQVAAKGKRVLVIDQRDKVAGNIRTETVEGINVHLYGPHIFHTNDEQVWQFINRFASFNRFTYSPMANYKGSLYNLPFNMNTFYQLWGCIKPEQAESIIRSQSDVIGKPANLEEAAISMIGSDLYNILVKGYTEKQWSRPCKDLPSFIIQRLPVRFTYDNNYFNDHYQGIPIGGYTGIIEAMLKGIEVRTQADYLEDTDFWNNQADAIIYTGAIDQFFGYEFGPLEYRSLRFEHEILELENYQGNAVINYTDKCVPFTRIIEHKHFEYGRQKKTVISREFPLNWSPGRERYYPVNDKANNERYFAYKQRAKQVQNVTFLGRLGRYQYLNMDQIIAASLKRAQDIA